jgi:hypothetical protein
MTTYTVITLFQVEAESREDALAAPDGVPNGETEVFAVAAPLRAVVLTMNQPLVAVEMLADMARRRGKPLPEYEPKNTSGAGDTRRFTFKK